MASVFRSLGTFFSARGALLLRGGLASLQLIALVGFANFDGLPLDDAWIHQVVARTFAESGTLGYAVGQHGAAATSYLWAALLAFNLKFLHVDPVVWAFALNAASTLVAGQLLMALVSRARPLTIPARLWQVASFLAALLATTSANILWFAHSGMEAPLVLSLSLLAIYAASAMRGTRAPWIAGVASGLLALTRPECIPLGFLLVGYLLVCKRGLGKAIAVAVPAVLGVAIYTGSNLLKTGHLAPATLAGRRWLWFDISSGLSRLEMANAFGDEWVVRLSTYSLNTSKLALFAFLGLAAWGALRLLKTKDDGIRLLFAWALAHVGFYAVLLPIPGHGGRYQPFLPLLFPALLAVGAVCLVADLVRIWKTKESVWDWAALAAAAPWLALTAGPAADLREANARAVAHIQATEIGMGAFIDTLPRDGAVASFDIGGTGWASHRPILDAGGLSDPKTAALLEGGRLWEYFRDNQVRYLVLPGGDERVIPVADQFTTRLHLQGNPAVTLEPLHETSSPLDKWFVGFKATWNASPKQVLYRIGYTGAPAPHMAPPAPRGASHAVQLLGVAIPERDRRVGERMLAALDAAGLATDVSILGAPPAAAPAAGCHVSFGFWGIDVAGCGAIAEPVVLKSMLYEQLGPYLDMGDMGGALRNVAHVVARAKRLRDPGFDMTLPPVLGPEAHTPPLPGFLCTLLFGLALGAGALLEWFAARRAGATLSPESSAPLPAGTAVALALMVCAAGCKADGTPHDPSLMSAAATGDADSVALVLSRGARADERAPDGTTAVHLATRSSCLACLMALGRAGAPLNLPAGPRQRTALQDAILMNAPLLVEELLRLGADPRKQDAFGESALHLLARADASRAAAITQALLGAGADPNAVDVRGFTPLHAAAATDVVPLARALVERTPELVNAKTPSGETALDVADRYGKGRVADLLLRHGALERDPERWPPLHVAARMDSVTRVADLLAIGADVNSTFHGKTALDIAREHRSGRVAPLLEPTPQR
jgi:ankyrin repeat protein